MDTAAEVTILSDRVYQSLTNQPPVLRNTVMYAAGRGMQMDTMVVGPVELIIKDQRYFIEVYVAPIDDDMLLGLDFLSEHDAIVHLKKNVMTLREEDVPLYVGPGWKVPVVAKVTIPKRTVIPANSMMHIQGKLDVDLVDLITLSNQSPLLIPRCFYEKSNPQLCVVNTTDFPYTIRRNAVIAQATPAQELVKETIPTVQEVVTDNNRDHDDLDEKLKKIAQQAAPNLEEEQVHELEEVLKEYKTIFCRDEFDIGVFQQVEHSIETGNARPIRQRLRRTPMGLAGDEEKHLRKMLQAGVIEPSVSEWASPPVLIRKRDGSVRYAIDYRRLNEVIKKEVYPLPLIDECIDTLAGNEWFSKLDASSAYWQVKMRDEDKAKTAFITKYGLYQFTRMSFGLCNAPATYARAMELVLRNLTWEIVLAFLDDILVMGKDFQSHLSNLRQVFDRFQQYGIKLKPAKCEFCAKETTFLGRKVDKRGMGIGEDYIKTIRDWKPPKTVKQVEQFLGFINYHRTFIKDLSNIASPLTELTKKNPWKWGTEQQTAYEKLKMALQTTPVLALPNKTDVFVLDTDASDLAIGAELL